MTNKESFNSWKPFCSFEWKFNLKTCPLFHPSCKKKTQKLSRTQKTTLFCSMFNLLFLTFIVQLYIHLKHYTGTKGLSVHRMTNDSSVKWQQRERPKQRKFFVGTQKNINKLCFLSRQNVRIDSFFHMSYSSFLRQGIAHVRRVRNKK